MNLNSTIPVDPLQSALNTNGRTLGVGISLARLGVSAATTNTHKVETRIASVGPSSTREISNTLPAEGPPILVSELLIAYQETYQPKLLRRQPVSETVAGQDHSLQNDTTGMQLDNVTIDNNALMDQINQHINSNTQQIIDQGNNSTAGIPQNSVPNITQDFSLPDLQSYGQGTGFETGYGDINLSALDELFDSDFGGASGSGSGNNNVVSGSDNDGYNADSTLGGLSSTLNSINQDFASSFPSATEPNGTPSPTKKEVSSSSSSNNNNDNNVSNGTNKSDSPTKSMFEGTYGGSNNSLESRGNSPRKSLNLNGSEDDLSLPEYLDDVLDEGNRVKTLSRIQISQLRIEWTEYGVLSKFFFFVSKILTVFHVVLTKNMTAIEFAFY